MDGSPRHPVASLRVLLSIHHDLSRDSGAAGVILRLTEEYRRLGHEVRTVSFDDLPARWPRVARMMAFPAHVARAMEAWRPDVADCSSGDAALAYARAPARPMLRITHSHGLEHLASASERLEDLDAGRRTSLAKRLGRHGVRLHAVGQSFRRADLSLVLNEAEARFLCDRLAIAHHRIHRARLGTDHAGIIPSPSWRRQNVVQIGAYIPRKGIRQTAIAMTAVMRRWPDVAMLFLGTGTSGAAVREDFPPELHGRISVVPTYANAELPGLLADSAVCLMPSLFEGYGIAKLEAMACGVVPIVSDDPGAALDVTDGQDGLIVPRRNAAALEAAIAMLLTDRLRLAVMAGEAVRTASLFSWQAAASERLALYARHLDLIRTRRATP
jgi:glycosyltransferase involved in cell wall biosynthesis